MEAAIDFLREKGLSSAAKKADRIAAEGTTSIFVNGNEAIILEVNAETDFRCEKRRLPNTCKRTC